MSRSRILFLADAGAAVGGGHVMRCLTAGPSSDPSRSGRAATWHASGPAVLDAFADETIQRFPAPEAPLPVTVAHAAAIARAWGAKMIVLDHYAAGPGGKVLRATGAVVLALDDLRRPHASDLVLDSSLDRTPEDYGGVDALIGAQFALVREAFAALREPALERRSGREQPRRALIAMGLTDFGGITETVVAALAPVAGDLDLDVVVGGGAASLPWLQTLSERDRRIHLHVDSRDMAALTASADIAVGAGGSSVWERCCLGLPALTVVLADEISRKRRRAWRRGRGELPLESGRQGIFQASRRCIRSFLAADLPELRYVAAAARAICDGQGAEQVAARLMARLNEHPVEPKEH